MTVDLQLNDPSAQAALALHRFGFGPRPGDIAAIASDPRGALVSDLASGAGLISNSGLMSSDEALRAVFEFRQERKAARIAQRNMNDPRAASPGANDMTIASDNAAKNDMASDARSMPAAKPGPPLPQQIYLAEAKARYDAALNADIGFAERLVWFWSNHFCVSADKGPTRPLCGAYEREAIRPHVLGKFSDMLLAVETHPAMLLYLDNARSIGPDSFAGIRRGKGLNENLAREIMELHTLGVRSGYTQTDVTNFAKVITGWTIVPPRQSRTRRRVHLQCAHARAGRADGDRQDLSPRVASRKAAPCSRSCRAIRRPPSTSPPSLRAISSPTIRRRRWSTDLAQRFRDTGGDLKEVTQDAGDRAGSPGAPRAASSRGRANGSWPRCARAVLFRLTCAASCRRKICSASRCGGRRRRKAFPTTARPGSTAGATARYRQPDRPHRRQSRPANPTTMVEAALGPLASRRDAQGGRARGQPAAGAGAAADGARIPETVMP